MENKPLKCKICGKELLDSECEPYFYGIKRQIGCSECGEILKLQRLNIEHWNKFKNAQYDDPVEFENYYDDKPYTASDGSIVHVKTLDDCKTEYLITGRTKRVKAIIDDIDGARRHLYTDIGPYFEILESMFDKKNIFWKEAGNLFYYSKNAIVSYLVIHLKEYLDNREKEKSKYSIYRFINIINNNKKLLFEKQSICCVRTFNKSGDISKTFFEHFPIEDYLRQLSKILDDYGVLINSIDDYRNNVFAHSGNLKNKEESEGKLTLVNLRKIYNSLKVIYDGLSYSVAPDLFAQLSYDYNFWFGHLNQITEHYKKTVVEPRKK